MCICLKTYNFRYKNKLFLIWVHELSLTQLSWNLSSTLSDLHKKKNLKNWWSSILDTQVIAIRYQQYTGPRRP